MTFFEVTLAAFSALLSGLCAVLWHSFKRVEEMVEKTRDELVQHKISVAKEYATNEEVKSALERFTTSWNEVFRVLEAIRKEINDMATVFRDKLDTKQDRDAK